MHNLKYIPFFYIIFLFANCRSEQSPSEQTDHSEPPASLQCAFDSTSLQYGLFLVIDNLEIKLANLPTCDNILATDFQNYQIPDSAQSATISWHVGTSFFLTQNEKIVRIHRAVVDEKQDSIPLFHLYAVYENGKFSFKNLE